MACCWSPCMCCTGYPPRWPFHFCCSCNRCISTHCYSLLSEAWTTCISTLLIQPIIMHPFSNLCEACSDGNMTWMLLTNMAMVFADILTDNVVACDKHQFPLSQRDPLILASIPHVLVELTFMKLGTSIHNFECILLACWECRVVELIVVLLLLSKSTIVQLGL